MSELYHKLKVYADSDHLPMHMPGHKRRMGLISDPFFIDITEIDGFDNLHHPNGILKEAQMRAASLYRSEETHYLVNGSTAGILAAVSGCTSYGGKLLLARNSHKSAYHGVLLRGLKVQYIYPQSTGKMGINGVILPEDVDNALKKDPDIQAVLVTSPTYDGIVSDIEKIAEVVHRYRIPLIVDEAHGAHFPFSDRFPKGSVSCGADVVVHSLHKTLPSLTQTGLIHLNGSLVDREKIRRYLSVYQTSSPSYMLMAGIDECMDWIGKNKDAFERFFDRILAFRKKLGRMEHLALLKTESMDLSRVLVSVKGTRISGQELSRILRDEFQIELEMACNSYVCAITTVADTEENLERLLRAFMEVDRRLDSRLKGVWEPAGSKDTVLAAKSVCTLLEASEREKEDCPLSEAEGKVSGDFVTVYPPGIPLLAPGEVISREILDRILSSLQNGLEIHGTDRNILQVLRNGR